MRYKFFFDKDDIKSIAIGDVEAILRMYQGEDGVPDEELQVNVDQVRCYTESPYGPPVSLINCSSVIMVNMPDEFQIFFDPRGVTVERLIKAANLSRGYSEGEFEVGRFGFFDDIPSAYLDFDISVSRQLNEGSRYTVYVKTKEDYFQLMLTV